MGSTRRKFTPEYKAEAVQFVITSGQPIAEIARNLGIVETTLGNWVAKAREKGEFTERPLELSERATFSVSHADDHPTTRGFGSEQSQLEADNEHRGSMHMPVLNDGFAVDSRRRTVGEGQLSPDEPRRQPQLSALE